jgi:hypothetical protein
MTDDSQMGGRETNEPISTYLRIRGINKKMQKKGGTNEEIYWYICFIGIVQLIGFG